MTTQPKGKGSGGSGFRKRKKLADHPDTSLRVTSFTPDDHPEVAAADNVLTTEELQVLQEFRAVGKRGISGGARGGGEEGGEESGGGGGGVRSTPQAQPPAPAPPPLHRPDVVKAVAIIQDSVHSTQTWKPILEEVKLS